MNRQLYLVAYDVASPRRLRMALAVLRDYALGGQKSVFECWLTTGECRELHNRLARVLSSDEDRYFLLRLNARSGFRVLGRARRPVDPVWFYVG